MMTLARVLMIHNYYQQRGGEDTVVDDEAALLLKHGHALRLLTRHNDEINSKNVVVSAAETLWSRRSARMLDNAISSFQPDVLHVHNTFPLLSPSVYWTTAQKGIAVVQTLHNFRLLCAQAMFLRDCKICEDCMGKLPWRGVLRYCYRGSYMQSLLVVTMLALHRCLGTYRKKVSRYIALSEFCRQKFIEGGFPAPRIVVKPNFANHIDYLDNEQRNGFLYVGRLSPEKGLITLAHAAKQVTKSKIKVIGEGPCRNEMEHIDNVDLKGFLKPESVREIMRRSACLIIPSICHETFGLVAIEAFASGLPVIASRQGSLAELVKDGHTGLLFEPGNPEDLSLKMQWTLSNPEDLRRMGMAARKEYEAKYEPSINYRQLMRIYDDAILEVKQNVG